MTPTPRKVGPGTDRRTLFRAQEATASRHSVPHPFLGAHTPAQSLCQCQCEAGRRWRRAGGAAVPAAHVQPHSSLACVQPRVRACSWAGAASALARRRQYVGESCRRPCRRASSRRKALGSAWCRRAGSGYCRRGRCGSARPLQHPAPCQGLRMPRGLPQPACRRCAAMQAQARA